MIPPTIPKVTTKQHTTGQDWRFVHAAQFILEEGVTHLKQETGCIYVNNAGPWNAIMWDQLSPVVVLQQCCLVARCWEWSWVIGSSTLLSSSLGWEPRRLIEALTTPLLFL